MGAISSSEFQVHMAQPAAEEKSMADLPAWERARRMGLWAIIKEDYVAHRRDWTVPGFRAMAVYRFGVWRAGLRHKIIRAPLRPIYRFLYRYVRNHYGIEIPYTTKIGRRLIIEHQGAIVIHGFSEIGDDCFIRQGVTLGNRFLELWWEAPKVGNNVNIGAGAKIIGKVRVGDGAAIGANAVVIKDVPPGMIAVGIPAKVMESRSMRGEPLPGQEKAAIQDAMNGFAEGTEGWGGGP